MQVRTALGGSLFWIVHYNNVPIPYLGWYIKLRRNDESLLTKQNDSEQSQLIEFLIDSNNNMKVQTLINLNSCYIEELLQEKHKNNEIILF